MNEQFKIWFNTEEAFELLNPQGAIYLLLAVLIFYVGKLIYDWSTPYNLSEEFTKKDNKAVAVSFGGYILGLGIIVWSMLSSNSVAEPTDSPTKDLLLDLWETALWSFIGILLLQAARVINDKLLLYQFSNVKEIIEDKNIGTGAVQCGAFIGSALMVRAALTGEENSFLIGLVSTIVYFIIGQLAFIVFAFLYQKVSRYDLHKEIEQDNVAAGVSFGMTLSAIGLILSGYLMKSDSLLGLAVWFVISSFLLLTCRYLVDKIILPGSLLDEEISKDRNWGAAIIEGSAALGLAFILTSLI